MVEGVRVWNLWLETLRRRQCLRRFICSGRHDSESNPPSHGTSADNGQSLNCITGISPRIQAALKRAHVRISKRDHRFRR